MKEKVNQERVEKLAEHIARQVYNLAKDYLPRIENAGSESEKGEAKVTFAASWPAYHHSPSVVTKLSFSTSTKDETESRIDLEQTSMDFGDVSVEQLAKPEPLMIEGEVLNAEGWVAASDRLPDDELLVEIEDVDEERFTGCFGVDEDFEGTVFNCADGGILLIEHIVRWRHVEEEAEAIDPEVARIVGRVLTVFKPGDDVRADAIRKRVVECNYDDCGRAFERLRKLGAVDETGRLLGPNGDEEDEFNEHGVCMAPRLSWLICGNKKGDQIKIELSVAKAADGYRIGCSLDSLLPDNQTGHSAPCKLDNEVFADADDAYRAAFDVADKWLDSLADGQKAAIKKKVKAAADQLEYWFNSFYSAGDPWPLIERETAEAKFA